jgi:hypothetical protein
MKKTALFHPAFANKLTELLGIFSRHDLLRFRKYVASPFFNENQDLCRLLEILYESKTQHPHEKVGLWEKLFPGKPYDDTRFRRLCSDLMQLALDFLALQKYHTSSSYYAFLLHALAATSLSKHFDGVVRQAEIERDKTERRDADFHFLEYILHRRRHEHREHIEGKTASLDLIEKADYHFDCYYFTRKLEHYCEALGYRKMVSGEVEIPLLPGFLDYLKESKYLREPAVKAYFLVAQMMLHPDEEAYFLTLKSLLETHSTIFSKKELQTLFIHLMNYCIDTKINNGRTDYYTELFALYRIALDKEIIIENGELNPHHYKNIITIGFHVEAFSWVEGFIQNYTRRLPAAEQENALQYNMAQLYFQKKEYPKVLEQLREVEYQSIVYALGSKVLLLRTYFELGEYQALDSLIDSFRIYLRRNKLISNEVQQQYMNLLRFTRQLSSIAPYDKKRIEKIRRQIEACKALAVKKWLLEKAATL